MKIKYLDSSVKNIMNDFVYQNSFDGGFLQSWEWGDFKRQSGIDIQRIAILDDNDILMLVATVMTLSYAKFFKKMYIPRGPIISREVIQEPVVLNKVLDFFFTELEEKAKEKQAVFLRVEPDWWRMVLSQTLLADKGFKRGKRNIQPLHSLVMKIDKSTDDILAQMKQKTRYNVRLAERKGVDVKIYPAKEKLDVFLSLLKKTANWKQFKTHSDDYYKSMSNLDSDDFKLYVAVAMYNGVPIAANLVIKFKITGYYLMGASDRSYKNLMAPYLLHWEIIKYLKENACVQYDLWGVDAKDSGEDKREKTWSGFSDFKRGLAPGEPTVEYFGVWEKPYREKWYKFLNLLK